MSTSNRASNCRKRVGELRAIVAGMREGEAKSTLLRLAMSYELMAQTMESPSWTGQDDQAEKSKKTG